MTTRMDQGYFEEKQEFAHKGLGQAVTEIQGAVALIQAQKYSMPGLVDPGYVHERLKYAESLIEGARRDFEKACWAAAKTEMEFDDWLRRRNLDELVWPK